MKVSIRNLSSGKRKWRAFVGGIKPLPSKSQSLRSAIMATPVPPYLYFPLQQPHCGTATACVAIGDRVLKGQKIADAGNAFGLPIHASSSGSVVSISDYYYPDEFGSSVATLCIKTDGKDEWCDRKPGLSNEDLTREALLRIIHNAGIGGLGGAGFPTWRKLNLDIVIDTLIINASECEPFITADQALIREYAGEVVRGARILKQISQASRCLFAIEADKADAISALQSHLSGTDIELIGIPVIYPVGSEKQLVQLLTHQQVPSDKLPSDIGVVMLNVGTAHAVHNAVVLDEPLISRITTLCGDTLRTPKNFCVLIGTPIEFLLELCGVDYSELSRLVMGGALMGITLHNRSAPVIKTTNCLIAGSNKEFPPPSPALACIRCGQCSTACPATLLPHLLYSNIRAQKLERAQQLGLDDCIECGACAYVCPSHIPLVQYYRGAKAELHEQQLTRQQSEKWQLRYQIHQRRLNENVTRKQGNRRRTVASVDIVDVTDKALKDFSRDQAREDIADALARVKAKKALQVAQQKTSQHPHPYSSDGESQ